MERAAFLSNELPRRGGPSPQARWDARKLLGSEARAEFLETLEEERLKVRSSAANPALTAFWERYVKSHEI